MLKRRWVSREIQRKAIGVYYAFCYVSTKNPRRFTGFCTASGRSQPDLRNRASSFDRIRSRVGTRECLKPAASPCTLQARYTSRRSCASVFLFYFFLPRHPFIRSKSQTRARTPRIPAIETSRRPREVTRSKSHTGIHDFFKRFPLTSQRVRF